MILGWCLGILSPLIVDYIRKHRTKVDVKNAIVGELEELSFRLLMLVYDLSRHVGEFNRDTIEWLLPYVESYEGVHQDNALLTALRKFRQLTDEQLLELGENNNALRAKSLKKYDTPFLDLKLDFISFYPSSTQKQLLEIRSQNKMLHEMIDESRDYFKMTFDSTIGKDNYSIVTKNLDGIYRSIFDRAKIIVKYIKSLKFE